MLMLLFFVLVMMGVFFYMSILEFMVYLLVVVFLGVVIVDWEGLWINYVSSMFMLDLMSVWLIFLSLWVGVLMLLASFNSRVINEKAFLFYLIMMVFFLLVCFSFSNLLGFFLFFEGVLLPIVLMIFSWGYQPERLQAGIYMLFYTLFGSLPLFVFLLMNSVSLSYVYVFWLNLSSGVLMMFLITVAFFVKVPIFFFHLWLPKAHVEAPISGSMILAGVLLKLGIYGLFRFKIFMGQGLVDYSYWIMSVSLMGAMLVGVLCLGQVDLKSLIAYSSVCHMGLALGGFMSLNSWGGYGSLVLMLGHGLCSSGLFCLANIMYERFFTRSLVLLKGMGLLFPFLSVWWFLFSVSNMAAPPTMNLVGEILLLSSMMKYSLFMIIPLFLVTFFSACYSLYMFSYSQHGKGWVMYGVFSISMREYFLMLVHFFPLVLWVLKVDLFIDWI
uniref:NADH dehydrogenase subunit 4 n=1 Tax=Otobius lagophilus TaxID=2944767 RepID=UPI0022383D11|nr:NADH dehydrogenase subunit 4 [Otobius lagophilus]UYB78387.1 NADH dehydrogenase subunit 4 [Otobius lagophilus]UYB78400.1 NADH dehydrogenase subunit 4 [Otobius lagophilus]UYL27140.1 NADH dehydrogenase subunit 4 [Otobius lagophilus]